MAFIDRLLLRGPEETARAEALREFRRVMPAGGRFSQLAESGVTEYYERRFGRFEIALDRWNDAHATALRANPQLRRIDVIADSIFDAGRFELCKAGPIRSDAPPFDVEGLIAIIRLKDRAGRMGGMLTLDIGSEVRFSKLRLGLSSGRDYLVRLSIPDGGMIIGPNMPEHGRLTETVRERAPAGSDVFQTVADAVAAIRRIIGR